jgi:NAD(P)H dehydrogenase (quinone)
MKILIVYYSLYGHMFRLAQAAASAVAEVPGAEPVLRRVAEFDVVEKAIEQNDYMKQVRESQKDIPIVTLDDVKTADGYLFGSPTRFGNMAAQMKQLFDTMGGLWMQGALEGKPAGVFTSTGSTHGGQETTLFTMMAPLLHLGTVVVGIPYSTEGLAHVEARGASPYGASTIAGTRGELQPVERDLFFVSVQAKRIAEIARKLRG